ncbi:hypothetical protein [Xylanimonas protaetiae]|uniref:Uncharacterized protein n=1 Tax=Xylanimonas protaetiae TaxID=2509457 RepID=A0A4P6FA97_9MICO|nr:hypothetical protein [Xylanimonas protaetiae]QAY71209.1 hypothetical protein ET471_15210 [Xylanimonas protaetiae]
MSDGGVSTPSTTEQENRVQRLLQESMASAGRIALAAPSRNPDSDPRSGGDASKAPTSLSAVELHPIEGDSSGKSWDDPDEL